MYYPQVYIYIYMICITLQVYYVPAASSFSTLHRFDLDSAVLSPVDTRALVAASEADKLVYMPSGGVYMLFMWGCLVTSSSAAHITPITLTTITTLYIPLILSDVPVSSSPSGRLRYSAFEANRPCQVGGLILQNPLKKNQMSQFTPISRGIERELRTRLCWAFLFNHHPNRAVLWEWPRSGSSRVRLYEGWIIWLYPSNDSDIPYSSYLPRWSAFSLPASLLNNTQVKDRWWGGKKQVKDGWWCGKK